MLVDGISPVDGKLDARSTGVPCQIHSAVIRVGSDAIDES